MKSSEIETAIRRAVDKLFVNGAGTEATRLVLTVDHQGQSQSFPAQDIGGWCKHAVVDIITNEFSALAEDDVEAVFAGLTERFPDHLYRQITIMDGQGGNCAQIITQRSIHSSRSNVWQGATLAEALSAAMEGNTK